MGYRLKIGTSEFNKEIQGTEDWTQTVIRDFTDKLLRVRGDYKFVGWQGLYSLLYSNFAVDGVCTSLEGKLFFRGDKAQAFEEIWRGEIKPQDGEHDLINSSVDSQLLDNTWSAKINNAKDQNVNLFSKLDKNNNFIAPVISTDADFFDPSDGSVYGDTRKTVSVFNAFEYLIKYLTDNTLGFASDYFSTGDGANMHITLGRELREYTGKFDLIVSFEDLFDEMQKKFNLWIIIESDDFDNPVLRIEHQSYVFEDNASLTVENPESVVVKTDLDQLYTYIKVGGDALAYDPDNDINYASRPLKDWNTEEYNTSGDCDFENNELNLVSSYKIDSNSIEYQLKQGSDDGDFDDDVFIVEVDSSNDAIKYQNGVTQANANIAYFYNQNLNNEAVLINWFTALPEQIADLYTVYVDTVEANTFGSGDNRIVWTNDSTPPGSDPDNIYTILWPFFSSSYFTAPVSGMYTFEIVIYLEQSFPLSSFSADVELLGFDTASVVASDAVQRVLLESFVLETGSVQVSRTVQMAMNVGDFATTNINVSSGSVDILSNGYQTIIGGAQRYDIDSPFELVYEYDINRFALPVADFDSIRDSRGYVRFLDTKTGRSWNVWPTEMTYSHEKQIVTSGKFIGRSPLNPDADLCWVLDGDSGLGFWDDNCYWFDNKTWVD